MVTIIRNDMVTNMHRRSDTVFKAIADPTRRRILGLLRARGRTVGGIASHFRTSRPAISKHLRLLRTAGLVHTRKLGTATICQLNAGPLRVVNSWLGDYETFWTDNLRSLKKFIEENP
jgi:DNA-binding transcriptional ArsR family regulator